MKTNTKVLIGVIALVLSAIMLAVLILNPFSENTEVAANGEVVRLIGSDKLNNVTLEEKTEQVLSQFDDYGYEVDEENGAITFEGITELDLSQIMALNFVNSYDEKVTKVYKTCVDTETFDFNIVISYYQNEQVIQTVSHSVRPYYVEEVDDYFIDYEGEHISLAETLVSGGIENCIMIVDDVAAVSLAAVAALALVTVIICTPQFQTEVKTVVTTIVKSFCRWFKKLFKKETVVTQQVETVVNYKLRVFNKDFTLKKVKEDSFYRNYGNYYLAVIVDSDVYVSEESITQSDAIVVLAANTKVVLSASSTKEYQLNTYTYYRSDARYIAEQAATVLCLEGAYRDECHKSKPGMYFDHYHPGRREGRDTHMNGATHSFFGSPCLVR